jgi:hypothetical protein
VKHSPYWRNNKTTLGMRKEQLRKFRERKKQLQLVRSTFSNVEPSEGKASPTFQEQWTVVIKKMLEQEGLEYNPDKNYPELASE